MSRSIEHVDTLYFDWLCSKVGPAALDYEMLLSKLHHVEYAWIVLGDDNRAEDVYDLRLAFFRESFLESHNDILDDSRRSVLEVLIAFSNRASFETDMAPQEWFWIMLTNLSLVKFPDPLYSEEADAVVCSILNTFIWRLYNKNGFGGLFPLERPRRDQRRVEIWYQFSEYLVANNYI